MNIVYRRCFTVEVDIWEPLQKKAEAELDEAWRLLKIKLSHSGNVKITPVSEVRSDVENR